MKKIVLVTLISLKVAFLSYAQLTIPGIVAYYDFAQFSNPNAGLLKDVSGNSNDGGVVGGQTFTGDRFGRDLQSGIFNGQVTLDNFIRINGGSDIPAFSSITGFSVSFWMYKEGTGGTNPQSFIEVSDFPTLRRHRLRYDINSNKIIYSNGNKTFTGVTLTTTSILTVNTWFHVALSVDPDSSKIKLYINGKLDAQIVSDIIYPSVPGFFIGRDNQANQMGFKARFDDFNILNRNISHQEALDFYNYCPVNIPAIQQITTLCGKTDFKVQNSFDYHWYNTSIGGEILQSGPIFSVTTTGLNTLYVAGYDYGCESKRLKIVIPNLLKPSVTTVSGGITNKDLNSGSYYLTITGVPDNYVYDIKTNIQNGTIIGFFYEGSDRKGISAYINWSKNSLGIFKVFFEGLPSSCQSDTAKFIQDLRPLSITSNDQDKIKINFDNDTKHVSIFTKNQIEKLVVVDLMGNKEEHYSKEFETTLSGLLIVRLFFEDKVATHKIVMK